MNRSLIVLKKKSGNFIGIRIHWSEGKPVEDWLKANYSNMEDIVGLMDGGHRSSIKDSYKEILCDGSKTQEFSEEDFIPFKHNTLKGLVAHCEHNTLAYFNGKNWKFSHK